MRNNITKGLRIETPTNRVTKHLRIGSQFLSEEDMLMVPNVDELRFKKVLFDIKRKTQKEIQDIVTLFVKELLSSHPEYFYYALRRLATKVDGTGIFILVLKHKKHADPKNNP